MAFSTPERGRQADGEEAGHKKARDPWSLDLVSDVAQAAEGPTYSPRSPPLLQAGFGGWAESPWLRVSLLRGFPAPLLPSPHPNSRRGPMAWEATYLLPPVLLVLLASDEGQARGAEGAGQEEGQMAK